MKQHVCTLWMYSHFSDSGLKYSFKGRLRRPVCQCPALPKVLASTYIFKTIYTVYIIPFMIPSILLPEVSLLQPYFSKVSSFFSTADFPFNTVELPLGQVLERCLLSSLTLFKHAAIMRINMVFFSLHVSFPSRPLGSTGFMQTFRLSVVLCFILLLVSRDLPSHFLHCWC